MATEDAENGYHAWNPGIKSQIPHHLLPLATLFRPETAFVDYGKAKELGAFFGLKPIDFHVLRPQRLAVHEVTVRVTADLSVPDGPDYGELGINLRAMVELIMDGYVAPRMDRIDAVYDQTEEQVQRIVRDQWHNTVEARSPSPPKQAQKPGFFARLPGRSTPVAKAVIKDSVLDAIPIWQDALNDNTDPVALACLQGLLKFVGGQVGQRGRFVAGADLVIDLVTGYVCNTIASTAIGDEIDDIIREAAEKEGYRYLPVQPKPVVMNVKGASAAGKSTIRPQQRALAMKLGIPWEDFALISPDYWRKYLLDYESLGDDFRYAAMLTGQELVIIDRKLDQYMAKKAARGKMSHLLIDRFRFDSFTPEKDRSADSKLLTRFGDRIFMFFMVTPPSETVVRAWRRGLKTGRYKAVDDLLYHNIEAYEGMPELFFSWALSAEKKVHFEFLDNDVAEGAGPKTIAFGWNNTMTILDVESMINVDRFRKVNVNAQNPKEISAGFDQSVSENLGFALRCIRDIAAVNLADQDNGYLYCRIEEGCVVWMDASYIEKLPEPSSVRAVLSKVSRKPQPAGQTPVEYAIDLAHEQQYTFGRWNTE